MNSHNNESNFSFVYSYYTDPRVVEAQRIQEEVISHCRKNVEMITKEMNELKALLAAITMKYKVAEDARRVMYKRNSLLMDDNEFLKEKLRDTEALRAFAEKSKCQLEKEAKEKGDTVRRLETALKEIISEGVPDKRRRRALLVRHRTTSTTNLKSEDIERALLEEDNQIIINKHEEPEPEKSLEEEVEDDKSSETTSMVQSEDATGPIDTASSAPTVEEKPGFDEDEKKHQKRAKEPFRDIGNVPKEPEIKEPLTPKDREAGRAMDRFRHVRLVKVMQELERQKHMNSWKNSELNNKTRELKMKDVELFEAKKEILILKNKLSQNSLTKMRLNAKRRIENAAYNAKKFAPRQEAKESVKTPKKDKDKEKEKADN